MEKLKGIKLLSADGESALIDSLTMGLHHGTVLGEDNIVEVYIRSLREKLKDKEHKVIRTVRGAGYRWIWHETAVQNPAIPAPVQVTGDFGFAVMFYRRHSVHVYDTDDV